VTLLSRTTLQQLNVVILPSDSDSTEQDNITTTECCDSAIREWLHWTGQHYNNWMLWFCHQTVTLLSRTTLQQLNQSINQSINF